jgi:predicted DNA-binding transcriptional regulator AlpA
VENHNPENLRFLRAREVVARTGLSKATLWRMQRAGAFPRPHRLSPHRVGWLETEVAAWARQQVEARISANDDLLTAREVTANYLLPPPTIRAWTRRGLLHPVSLPRGEMRYRRDEIERRLRMTSN